MAGRAIKQREATISVASRSLTARSFEYRDDAWSCFSFVKWHFSALSLDGSFESAYASFRSIYGSFESLHGLSNLVDCSFESR